MPERELRIVEQAARSTLYVSQDGSLYRKYSDTGRWTGPHRGTVDERGVYRSAGNRRVDDLVHEAWSEETYRGTPRRQTTAYLQNALRFLSHEPRHVDEFAHLGGEKTSTARGYACEVVDHWPGAAELASRMVYPPLWTACQSMGDRSGSLKYLMARLPSSLRGDIAWRCLPNRYAHLRLARLCLDAMEC